MDVEGMKPVPLVYRVSSRLDNNSKSRKTGSCYRFPVLMSYIFSPRAWLIGHEIVKFKKGMLKGSKDSFNQTTTTKIHKTDFQKSLRLMESYFISIITASCFSFLSFLFLFLLKRKENLLFFKQQTTWCGCVCWGVVRALY